MAGIEANIVSIAISIGLLLLMQAGFLCLETGLVRSKNSINVAAKNLTDLIFVIAVYWMVSFSMIYGDSLFGFIAVPKPFLEIQPGQEFIALYFLVQALFCATAITIVSGCIAERCQLRGYIAISIISSLLIYPFVAHWAWGGTLTGGQLGWLKALGFYDFAGATVVHSVGGWVALSALLIIGPRTGISQATRHHFKGQNLALTILGVFFLWIGWFGFNGGSNLGDTKTLFTIFVNTAVAGAFGGIAAMSYNLAKYRNFDVLYMANGLLSGLVAVTAGCSVIGPGYAAILGVISSLATCLTLDFFVKKNLDDVVGAIPVHLVGGIWGTLAVGLVGDLELIGTGLNRVQQMGIQLLGILSAFAWSFPLSYFLIKLFDRFFPIRVTPEDEIVGLNVSEHNARNELHDLIIDMERHIKDEDYSRAVQYDQFTEVGVIAAQYNRVVEQVLANHQQLKSTIRELQDTQHLLKAEMLKAEKANINKSEFLANISHEIRTPLNGIYGVCQLIDVSGLTNEQAEYIDVINRSAETLVNIINDVLDYSKIEAGEIDIENAQFSTTEFFDNINSLFFAQAHNSFVEWIVDVDSTMPELLTGDRVRLSQVLINILGNAFKFTEKGKVKLSARYNHKANTLELRVSDTGIGIEEKCLTTIFRAYQQAGNHSHSNYGGTGLGLSICQNIIALMGGTINVSSQVGLGTEFEIKVPTGVAKQQHETPVLPSTENNVMPASEESFSALVVDDNPVNLMIMKRMLESFGARVTLAEDGVEALDIISQLPNGFDVIFMDCEMPRMDGITATKEIKALYKTNDSLSHQPKIIGLSAHAFSTDRHKGLNSGMDGYLTKPVKLDDVKRTLADLAVTDVV